MKTPIEIYHDLRRADAETPINAVPPTALIGRFAEHVAAQREIVHVIVRAALEHIAADDLIDAAILLRSLLPPDLPEVQHA